MSHRDYARQQLVGIALALQAGRPLQREHVRFLIDAGTRAAKGEDDPLGWSHTGANRPGEEGRQLAMARHVQANIKRGLSKSEAYRLAGEAFNVQGTPDGAAAKAYRARSAELAEMDAFYAERARQARGESPSETAREEMRGAIQRTLRGAAVRNRRK
mgnify:FL=1